MVYVQSSIVLVSIFSQAQVGAHFRVGNQGTRLNFRAAPAARALSKEINQSTAIATFHDKRSFAPKKWIKRIENIATTKCSVPFGPFCLNILCSPRGLTLSLLFPCGQCLWCTVYGVSRWCPGAKRWTSRFNVIYAMVM